MAFLKVKTEYGWLEGDRCDDRNISVFKGIPYAKAPLGDLRWKRPMPPEKWTGTRQAKAYGPISPQLTRTNPKSNVFAMKEWFPCDEVMDEDCLYLNVWTPAESTNEKLPVMMWIFGGGNRIGFSYSNYTSGISFARQGIVFVTIGFRIGTLGNLVHPELDAENEEGISGNYTIFDQIAALKWCRSNISAFGGDPDNITIFGESSGSMSVQALFSSPLTKGDIRRAIMESGGGIFGSPEDKLRPTLKQAEAAANLNRLLGVKTIKAARELPWEEIIRRSTPEFDGLGIKYPGQIIDGYCIVEDDGLLALHNLHPDIDFLVGCTSDESPRQLRSMISWCENQITCGKKSAYLYQFSRPQPGDPVPSAFHGSELYYVFNTLSHSWRNYAPEDYVLANQINKYWGNFAKTGNPNGTSLPNWSAYSSENRSFMRLDVRPHMESIPEGYRYVTLENYTEFLEL